MSGVPSVLITGGAGFVGRHLSRRIAELLPDYRKVSLQLSGDGEPPPGWELLTADVTDMAAVEQGIAEVVPDVVLHLAGQASVAQAQRSAGVTWGVNLVGSFAIARAVAQYSPDALVLFTSTAEVYGTSFNDGPVSETSPVAPLNPYSASKYAAERMFEDVLPQSAKLVVARPFNHTGAGQDERFALPSFAKQIASAERTRGSVRVGNLQVEREMLHVEDVVDAYVALVSRRNELPPRTTVNIAAGVCWRIGDLLDRLIAKAATPLTVEIDPALLRPVDVPRTLGDASLLHTLTGWAPRRGIDETLDEILEWARLKLRAASAGEPS